jgi:enediyne biosynthesis protein E4
VSHFLLVEPMTDHGRIRPAASLGLAVVLGILSASLNPYSQGPKTAQFVDVAKEAGITDLFICGGSQTKKYILETLGSGVALFDYDRDGHLDAFFANASTLDALPAGNVPTHHLYRNSGNGEFRDVTQSAGLASSGWGQGVCVGDYDNDGNDDLFVTYYGHNELYRNQGEGKFVDVTRRAGLASEAVRWGTGCAFLDYDNDSHLDLFVANYVEFDRENTPLPGSNNNCLWRGVPVMCGPRGLKPETNLLYRNNGDGTFRDVSKESGILKPGGRYALSVTTLDFNKDGWLDLYVAVDSQGSLLYRNQGNGRFDEIGVIAGVAYSEDGREQAGMGTAAGDYDGDGFLDLVKTNFANDTSNLYRNHGDGTFEEVSKGAGMGQVAKYLGWGAAFLDYDNDTWPDVLLVNGHVYPEVEGKVAGQTFRQARVLYRNQQGKRFANVSELSGPGITEARSSRGMAAGDYDNDGDLDVFINNIGDTPSLLRNDGGNQQNFLSLFLVGTKSNRNGIGARVMLTTGTKKQLTEVRSGSSFISHHDFRLHFGLANLQEASRIEIQWPSGIRQVMEKVKANQFLKVVEPLPGERLVPKRLP